MRSRGSRHTLIEVCECGNVLRGRILGEPELVVTMHPCRCKAPGVESQFRGPKPRSASRARPTSKAPPDWVSKSQYEERKRLGLPVATDIEKAARQRWT